MSTMPEIMEIESVLCEDGYTIMFYGNSDDPDRTYVASATLSDINALGLPALSEIVSAGESFPTEWSAFAAFSPLTWRLAS